MLRSLGWWTTLVGVLGGVWSPGPAIGQVTARVGTLTVQWGDGPPGSGLALPPRFTLTEDQGGRTPLEIDEVHLRSLGGPLALNGRRVTVRGTFAAARSVAAGSAALWVNSLRVEGASTAGGDTSGPAASAALVSGAHPWVTILCRFADSAGTTPAPSSYFEGLMGAEHPGMNHYWQEQSYGTANIDGSLVVGWFTLPRTRAQYFAGGSFDVWLALDDCTQVADSSVFFPSFDGVNLMFNETLDCCAWGGSGTLTRDGQVRVYRVTWLPPWGWQDHDVVGHEMGHGFGLPHSSGPYAATYDSRWDVMSGGGQCQPAHPTYGCLGVHTISFHKDLLGWVSPSHRYVPDAASSQTITLEPLSGPVSGSGYHLARIPIGTGDLTFYTVEARRFIGYDSQVPGEAVVIHDVNTAVGGRRARVVDGDTGNTNPNDAGSMWLPGETFTDAARAVSVQVNASTAMGFQVTITVGRVAPEISVTPLALNFGGVAVGAASATQYVTVRQDGAEQLSIGTLSKGGADPTEFRMPAATNLCSDESLKPGESCTVGVRFQPSQVGVQTATIVIPNGDPNENPVTVTLTGTGLGSEVNVTPAALSFGSVAVGGTSGVQWVSIHNAGPANLVLGTVTVATGGPEFTKTSDGCSEQTVAAFQACLVGVQLAPAAPGTRTGMLQVPTNDVDESVVSVTLAGTGLGPEVRTAPAAVDFGSLPVGVPSTLQFVTVTNDGPGILALGTLFLGGTSPSEFRKPLARDGCSGRTLASGQSCTVGVRFKPGAEGSMAAKLKIPTTDADEALVKIQLTGTGVGP